MKTSARNRNHGRSTVWGEKEMILGYMSLERVSAVHRVAWCLKTIPLLPPPPPPRPLSLKTVGTVSSSSEDIENSGPVSYRLVHVKDPSTLQKPQTQQFLPTSTHIMLSPTPPAKLIVQEGYSTAPPPHPTRLRLPPSLRPPCPY